MLLWLRSTTSRDAILKSNGFHVVVVIIVVFVVVVIFVVVLSLVALQNLPNR